MLKKNSNSNENLTCHFVFKNLEKINRIYKIK